jgi:hypothetical protein
MTRGSVLLAGLLLTVAMLGATAAPELAGPPDPTIPPGGTRFREGHPLNRSGQDAPKFHGVPRDGRHDHRRDHFKRFHGPIVFPGRCWAPGYWAYQWVPQYTPYHVWVPGYWSVAGTWVAGHYQTQYYTTGAYQPYWVEGYWSAC